MNNIYELIKTGEGYTLELKERFSSSIGKEICAFANASGGKIILGIKDSGEIIKESTQKTTQKILELLKQNPKYSRKALSEFIEGITEDGIKYNLEKLKKEGKIKRIGPDKGGYWEVLE